MYFSTKITDMLIIERYQDEFAQFLKENVTKIHPATLYEPMHYILNLGGKRIRPVLTMLSADVFGADYKKALFAALAVEIFHNFSLVHDDIMDKAPLRRGKATIHTKWNLNTAILSGDAMLILAYQYFERYEPHIFKELASIFGKTASEVCEGQQFDLDFENQQIVTIDQYLKMIEYKTAVLVGAALQMGAVVAETSVENKQIIYDFGVALGIAFQLQDDYLDTFGNADTFGKKIGGDILENKKTMLYIKALENGNNSEKQELMALYASENISENQKIQRTTQLFKQTKSDVFLRNEIKNYTEKAFSFLDTLKIPSEKKAILRQFGMDLMDRKM